MTARTKKFKFNIIDLVIIIVALACIVGLILRAQLADQFDDKEQSAVVTFRVAGILKNSVDKTFVEGDEYYCDVFKDVFGTMGEIVEQRPAVQVSQDEDGISRESTIPYRQDITATMKCTGAFNGAEFFIGGTNRVIPGQAYEVYSLNRKMTIQIISVEPVK